MIFTRKYGVSTITQVAPIFIPMIKRGVVDFALSTDWTPGIGDMAISQDGGAAALITAPPVAIAMVASTMWRFDFTAAELSCKQLMVLIRDGGTRDVEDQMFIVETYGHANAMYPADYSANTADSDARFTRAVGSNVMGTVGTGSTTTSIVTNSLDPPATATDQFRGLIVKFPMNTATAALRGMGTSILSSTAGGVLTVDLMCAAPVNGDIFTIT